MENPFKNEKHHIELYKKFAEEWELTDLETFVQYYDVHELSSFLPINPTNNEKEILKSLIGVTTPSGYMDYQKSNNTFELIMQWREKTDNLGENNNFLSRD